LRAAAAPGDGLLHDASRRCTRSSRFGLVGRIICLGGGLLSGSYLAADSDVVEVLAFASAEAVVGLSVVMFVEKGFEPLAKL
jgi:hypothetical protein